MLVLSLNFLACAHGAGKQAAEGAIAGAKEAGPGQTAPVSQGLAQGILEEMSRPEQLARVQAITRAAGAGLFEGAVRGPGRVSSPRGAPPGPAGDGMGGSGNAATGREPAAATAGPGTAAAMDMGRAFAQGFTEALAAQFGQEQWFRQCQGDGRQACIQAQLSTLARQSSTSLGRGFASGLWPLVLAFGAGIGLMVVLGFVLGLVRLPGVPRTASPR